MTLLEVARAVRGEAVGGGEEPIRGVAPLETAGPDEISFVASAAYLAYLRNSRARAVLISEPLRAQLPSGLAAVVVPDAHRALVDLLPLFYPERRDPAGVHPSANVHSSARVGPDVGISAGAVVCEDAILDDGVRVGAGAFVGAGSRIGAGTTVHAQATVCAGVWIGERCILHPGARVGTEGFGYVWDEGRHRKVPQVGGCRIGNDVEIGANTTIDRGSIGDTVVGDGSKIDNLVHLGHNVRLGEHVIVIAQVGISGSTVVEDHVVIGGQVGMGGHLRIGRGARIGAQAGVTADVPAGETVSGYPARPHREALRAQAAVFRLPRLVERLRRLERSVFGSQAESNLSPADRLDG